MTTTPHFVIEDKACSRTTARPAGLSCYSHPRRVWLRGYVNGLRVYSELVGIYDARGKESGFYGRRAQVLELAERRAALVSQDYTYVGPQAAPGCK